MTTAGLVGALRRQGWLIVACAVGGAALLGTGSAMRPKTYESRVEIELSPVSLEARFGAPDAPRGDEQAMARELDYIRSDEVLGAIEASIEFDHHVEVEQVSDDTVAFVARSISVPYTQAVADTASATYLAVREQNATGQANSSVDFTQRAVDDLTARQGAGEDVAAELTDVQARLADYQAGLTAAAETAHVSRGPTVPGDPVAPRPWSAAAIGLVVGLVFGLVVAAFRERRRTRPPATTGGLPHVSLSTGTGEPWHASWVADPRVARMTLGGLVLLRAAVYAVQGANLVLDDWSLLDLRSSEGILHTVPTGQDLAHARPGAWLSFTVIYGAIGAHPLVLFAVVTALNLAVVLVLYAVFSRFVARPMALLITALWVVLPIHNTMTVWTATSQITVSTLLLLLGVLALTSGRWLLAGLAMAASILSYELSVVICLAAAVLVATPLVPLLPGANESVRTLSLLDRVKVLVMIGLATAWSRHYAVYPVELRMPSQATLWSGHFGIGLFGSLSTPNGLVVVSAAVVAGGVAACLVWWLAGDRARDDGPSLVLTGLGVALLGLYVAFTLSTDVLGFNDRLYSLSSIGAAMMLAGLALFVWRRLPAVAVGLVVMIVIVSAIGQVVSLRSWSQAGGDVVALLRYLDRDFPEPGSTNFLVGPTPMYRNNVVGITSPYGGAGPAYHLRYPDGTGSLVLTNGPDEFVSGDKVETLVTWSKILGTGNAP